jgi:hypothetical protein
MTLYTASMTSTRGSPPANADHDKLVTVSTGGTLTLGTPGFAFSSADAMTLAGTINAAGTVTFSSTVALTGTYNTLASSTTFGAAVTMTGSSAFNGGTGTTTFSVAPTLTSGTFTVGSSGTTGSVILSGGGTFALSMTLAFPANGGTLSTVSGGTISVGGIVTSANTGSTLPKINCPACTAAQGFTMLFTATATLNVDGLQFDHVSTAGVQIANGAAYAQLKRLKFTNNAGNSASGTHLAITKGTSTISVPGCYFDTTATTNVTLSGVSGSTGVHAIFEDQGTATNGTGVGEGRDLDADTTGPHAVPDGVADTNATPRWGAVVEWVAAIPSDTAGTAVGFPTAAFDWNTFAYYGIYAAFKNTGGASTADILWKRNNDGSAAYSFSVADTNGDLIGTPKWDTVNEVTAGLDVNGDGDSTDTNVHVVYIATAGVAGTVLPHITKLIDTGAALVRPTSGNWSTDFSSASVKTISSPLVADTSNLYFGGTDASNATKVFGVQISSGAAEKTLARTIGSVTAVTAAPSWKVYSGNTFLFLGSTSSVYRTNITSTMPDSTFAVTATVNDSVRLINNRAYAVTNAGKVYFLDASNFASGGFTNLTGSPYSSASGSAMKAAPYIDPPTNNVYVGDDGGKLYVITSAGVTLNASYPFTVASGVTLRSSPVYLQGGGVIAVGGGDGYVYFINRSVPEVFKRFFVTSSGHTVSSVAYNVSTSQYMVSSDDGKLMFINGSDVTDPDATE